jgi:CysZ protein
MGSVGGWVDALFEWQCVDEDSSVYWLCETFSLALSGVKLLFGWLIKSVFIMVYLAIYKNIILFLYSPVIAYLVEVVEQKDKGIEAPFIMEQFIKDTVRGIVIALRNLLLEGACVIALLVMAVVPVVNLFQPILLWLVSAYFLGFSMMDYSLERKRLNARSSVDYIKKHKSLATGIGAVFQLMYLVPFVGWMFAPTYSAVAAYFAVEELEKMNE